MGSTLAALLRTAAALGMAAHLMTESSAYRFAGPMISAGREVGAALLPHGDEGTGAADPELERDALESFHDGERAAVQVPSADASEQKVPPSLQSRNETLEVPAANRSEQMALPSLQSQNETLEDLQRNETAVSQSEPAAEHQQDAEAAALPAEVEPPEDASKNGQPSRGELGPLADPDSEEKALLASLAREGPLAPRLTDLAKPTDLSPHKEAPRALPARLQQLLTDLGGGTGASAHELRSAFLGEELMRRMDSQNKVSLALLLLAYCGSLVFSAMVAYQQSLNNSPITYYSDPRQLRAGVEGHDVGDFLEVFNQPPGDVQLQVTGMVPAEYLATGTQLVEWLGSQYRVEFSFALDLTPWLVREETSRSAGPSMDSAAGTDAAEGLSAVDLDSLSSFLSEDTNDLASVELQKEVVWPGWEELAMKIKYKIRQQGFQGIILVRQSVSEGLRIHKNRPWANFMHNRITKVVLVLSIVGWLVYQPYMWLKCRSITITSHFRVDVSIDNYWALIGDKLGAEGFGAGNSASD